MELMGYPEGSAGREMSPRYHAALMDATVDAVLAALRSSPLRGRELGAVFVIDEGRFYQGFVDAGSLLKADPQAPVRSLLEAPEVHVGAHENRLRAAALLVVGLKAVGFLITGSVAILSDAAESLTNIVAAATVLFALRAAHRPPDYAHPYGHGKAEYLSSLFEGALILVAALLIAVEAGRRLLNPQEVEALTSGALILVGASLLNGGVSWYLRRVARRTHSTALATNARHLMVDVYTSAGVLVALGLVALTGWLVLDPLIALYIAYRIFREGYEVLAGAVGPLLDTRLPRAEEEAIMAALQAHPEVRGFHRLRSRSAGRRRFAEVDIFVDPELSVRAAHNLVEALEVPLERQLPGLHLTVHVEPFEVGRRDRHSSPQDEFLGRLEPTGGVRDAD